MLDWMADEWERRRTLATARTVADAALMPSCGPVDASDSHAHPAANANPYPSPWPEPYDPAPDSSPHYHYLTSDPDVERWYHPNRDLQAMANRREAVGRGQRDVGTMADVRGDGVSDVLRARGEPVRREAGAKMTPREAADALVREAQADGEYEPLSRVPGLIDEIRRERDDLRERLTAIETMHRAWAQLDRNALWFALRHYLETGDTR